MDPSNPDDWTKLETAFTSAPLWAVIVATGATVGAAIWWFRGWMSQERLDALKEQVATVEQRLKLASEASAASERAKDELQKEIQTYKADVAAKGSNASPAKVEAAFEQLNKEDALVTHALLVARQAVEMKARHSLPVGLGYPVDTAKLEALRDLDGLGALRKLDPETLDRIKDIGKPIGTTLKSIPDHVKKRD